MTELQEAYDKTAEPCVLFTLTEARYGYIGYLLGINNKNEAKPLIESFETDIERLAVFPEYRAETEVIQSRPARLPHGNESGKSHDTGT